MFPYRLGLRLTPYSSRKGGMRLECGKSMHAMGSVPTGCSFSYLCLQCRLGLRRWWDAIVIGRVVTQVAPPAQSSPPFLPRTHGRPGTTGAGKVGRTSNEGCHPKNFRGYHTTPGTGTDICICNVGNLDTGNDCGAFCTNVSPALLSPEAANAITGRSLNRVCTSQESRLHL